MLSFLNPKPFFQTAICVFLVSFFLGTGFHFTAKADEKIRLRVSGLPKQGSIDPVVLGSCRVIERFLELNPDIELVPAEGISLPTVVDEASTIMMVAGGIAPDVMNMNFRSIDTFVRQGMIAPLDEYIAEEKARGVDVAATIPPQLRDVVYRPGPDGIRRLYGLPGQILVMGLYYNRELFRRAGLPPRAPSDWRELEEFATRISSLGKPYVGLNLRGGNTAGWNLMSFIWSAGGEAVEEIAPNEWRAIYNSREAVEAFKFYYELVEIKRVSSRLASPTSVDFSNIGMYFGYIGEKSGMDPELFGFGAIPKGPAGQRGSEINAQVLGVFSQIKDSKVRDAAWRFVLFTTGSEAEKIRIQTLVELGQAGAVNPVLLRKYGYDQFLGLTPPGLEAEFMEAMVSGKPEPYGKNCNLVYNEMNYPLDQILLSPEIRDAWDAGDMGRVNSLVQDTLDRAVATTNERMIGYVAPETMKFRRSVAVGVVIIVGCAFALVGWNVGRIFSKSSAAISRPVGSKRLLPWLVMLPALSLILVWHYIPLLRGTAMAFQNYQLVLPSDFVGLDNFALALFDRSFWNSILATLHYAIYTLTIGFAAPILLAYALHLIPRHKILFRTLYYLPSVITAASVFFLWRELFGVDGPLNTLLRMIGFEARRAWTEDPALAMLSCVIPGIWATAGPGCLIYLAALKTIPQEQFEASEIDGAGFLQKTVHIVFPGLRSLIFINFIGAVAAAFHGATNILIMTGGGPNGVTEVASLKIFYEAFTRLRFGPATAMAWIIGSMLVGLTILQLKRLSQMEFKSNH